MLPGFYGEDVWEKMEETGVEKAKDVIVKKIMESLPRKTKFVHSWLLDFRRSRSAAASANTVGSSDS